VEGSVNSARDAETINFELIFADMETVEKRLQKSEKMIKSGDKKYKIECDMLNKIKDNLESGVFARVMDLSEEERSLVSDLFLLTDKPMLYVANVSEEDIGNLDAPLVAPLKAIAASQKADVMAVCAKLEQELVALEPEERKMFLAELGVSESGLNELIRKSYKLLNYISFLTAGEKEVRAWTITKGTKAPGAAGKIHSDLERGFIRAEIVAFDDLKACGDMATARAKGHVRQEGKEYVMKDGDVTLFKFNV
jgi:GTP-binding protein YchF